MLHSLIPRLLLPVAAVLMVAAVPAHGGAIPAEIKGQQLPSLASMVDKVLPGVVNISTRTRIRIQQNPLFNDPFFRHFFDVPDIPRERETQSLGSGVIVDARQGYVLTNNHVIDRADEITVTLRDGRRFKAEVIGTDPESDVAVLQIDAEDLVAVAMANSDELRVGDFVVAIGNPFGLGQTVTSGIVSALGRSGLGIEGFENFIQTDASINPGNSGGALVNLRGELVGINTAIIGPQGGNVGIGFAIPVNMARSIMHQLVEFGEVRRGRLGVFIQDVTPELARALDLEGARKGAIVAQIVPDSPAQQSGLQVGDIVTAVNGEAVENAADLRNAIGIMQVGQRVELEVVRDGERREFTVVIGEPRQASGDAGNLHKRLAGASLGGIREDHPLFGRIEGVQVHEVEPGSPASRAGLRAGDIIVSVNRRSVKDMQDLREAAKRSANGLLLNVRRGNGALFLLLK